MKPGKDRGVTLTEMIVALMVLSVLAGVAMPLSAAAEYWRLRTAAGQLAAEIRETRSRAIVEGITCYLVFYETVDRYRFHYPDGSYWAGLPPGIKFAANNFPVVLDGRRTLYFRHTGAPNRGGHVALRDAKGNKLYVIVTPVTGRVRIDKVPP